MSPGGIKAAKPATAEEDAVRLTIDFDDTETDGPIEADAGGQAAEPVHGGRAGARGGNPSATADASGRIPPQLAGLEVVVSVEVGSRRVALRDLMAAEPGQLFPLDRSTHEPVQILVNGKPFAHGEVVAIGDRFGVRLLDLLPGGPS